MTPLLIALWLACGVWAQGIHNYNSAKWVVCEFDYIDGILAFLRIIGGILSLITEWVHAFANLRGGYVGTYWRVAWFSNNGV